MKKIRGPILVILAVVCGLYAGHAQDLPPCGERAHTLLQPRTDTSRWCIEQVIDDDSGGELAFTALAVGADGTLYAARPLAGQVLALADSDGDGLPDSPHVIADGLTLPNGLAYDDGALYISGGPHLYRLTGDDLVTLVDDLPAGPGFWTGGLEIGPDGRIYVAVGAPCDFCEPEDNQRGAVLSFALDGSDRQIVASGLRQPADVTWHGGALWTIDTARRALRELGNMDELNQVVPGAHFGWPYCAGPDNQPDLATDWFDCADAAPPALSLPTHSSPLALAGYASDSIPALENTLLVALGGAYNSASLSGYRIVAVRFDADGSPTHFTAVIPAQRGGSDTPTESTIQELNYRGLGLWPHRPYGIAVSPSGWVYISIGGGRIFALRPL